MNTTQPQLIMQRWHVVQHELLPELKAQVGPLTPKLEKVIHTQNGYVSRNSRRFRGVA